jgi:hypothetical protein
MLMFSLVVIPISESEEPALTLVFPKLPVMLPLVLSDGLILERFEELNVVRLEYISELGVSESICNLQDYQSSDELLYIQILQ